jgi:hypothetical protein
MHDVRTTNAAVSSVGMSSDAGRRRSQHHVLRQAGDDDVDSSRCM